MRFDTVIVGVDFTPGSRGAAHWVTRSFPGCRLVLVHACPPASPARAIGRRFAAGEDLESAAERGARERLEEMASEFDGRDVTTYAGTGAPHEVILSAASELHGDLLVIGPHMPRPGIHRLVGSTGEAFMGASTLPLLLAGDGANEPPRRILAPVDGSPITAEVLRAANELARRFGAGLQALYVHDTATFAALSVLHGSDRERVQHEAFQETSLWFEQYAQRGGLSPQDVELVVSFGEARHEILAMAQQQHTDLIVIGSHGSGGAIFRRVMGSVAAWVLRYTRRSVLVLQGLGATTTPSGFGIRDWGFGQPYARAESSRAQH